MARRSRRRRVVFWSLVAAGTLVGLVGLAILVPNLVITRAAAGHILRAPEEAPHAQCAIVLGARVYTNGTPAPMLTDRLQTGIRLYKLGKVDKILLSGDHGQTGAVTGTVSYDMLASKLTTWI